MSRQPLTSSALMPTVQLLLLPPNMSIIGVKERVRGKSGTEEAGYDG